MEKRRNALTPFEFAVSARKKVFDSTQRAVLNCFQGSFLRENYRFSNDGDNLKIADYIKELTI